MQTRTLISAGVLGVVALGTQAHAVNFYQYADVDLSPETSAAVAGSTVDIGTNASAVAWDGSTAYLAGINNSAANTNDTALINISNVLTTATVGTRYAVQTATAINGRGYLGLDYKAGVGIADVFDSGTTATLGEYTTAATAVFAPVTLAARPPGRPELRQRFYAAELHLSEQQPCSKC